MRETPTRNKIHSVEDFPQPSFNFPTKKRQTVRQGCEGLIPDRIFYPHFTPIFASPYAKRGWKTHAKAIFFTTLLYVINYNV